MPLDKTQVAELEAEINDEQLSKVRFGRSRFLRDASLALFGLTAGMFAAQPRAEAAPPGCNGAATCGSCRGARCARCRRKANTCGGNHCWRIRIGCRVFRCCDWVNSNGRLCICRGFVGYVC
jgi:hypothetical protein